MCNIRMQKYEVQRPYDVFTRQNVSKKLDSLGVSDCYSFIPLVRENSPQITLGSPVHSRLQPLM